jgi:sugar phosphate isomerase/epimerase
MYSLSTCWNSGRHTDGRKMLEEIRELGFEYAELSHGIRISLLPGIFDAVDAGVVKISTLHNFCPLPIGINQAAPNIYKFSSLDARERENAYKHTIKTLDTAERVGAKLVVLHTGEVEMKEYTNRLLDMLGAGQKESPKFEKLCVEAQDKREQRKAKFVENAYDMIRRLSDQAESRGLKLGIENREAVEEIPFESDFEMFFREFPNPVIGYWHDTGHAQIKTNLGFIHHEIHLESVASRLHGFHIHDVEYPGRDHRPPGKGTIDWAMLKRFATPEKIKVLEMSPSLPREEVEEGFRHLKSVWGEG